MPGPARLAGDRLTLHEVTPEDHGFFRRHWNDPDLRRWFATSWPVDAGRLTALLNAEDTAPLLPCRDGEPVGFLWLFDLDEVAGRGELGYWVRPADRGQGYATEAARLALREAFERRGLHKLLACVLAGNDPSRRVLERLGFRQEGHLRDHYYVDGDYVDATLYARLRE